MFLLTQKPFHKTKLDRAFANKQAGAFAAFEGRVRDHNDGASVKKLDYEVYVDLCQNEADKILREARASFFILDVRTYHRYGSLKVGDTAIWVGVLASHREDAFQATQYIVNQYKARLPIWKKEYYTNKKIEWVNTQTAQTSFDSDTYYSKQTSLTEFCNNGQEKLTQARVLVVGAGGLGASALQSLAGAGVGTLGIAEADLLEESNLHRQNIYQHNDIGREKIQLAKDFINRLNPSINIICYAERLTPYNAEALSKDFDIILDCTDNFKTKYLLNDLCVLKRKVFVSASVYQWEGQLFVYQPDQTACLRCLWPDIPPAGCVGTCTEAGVLGPVASIFGHMQALETIQQILKTTQAPSELIIYNLKAHHQKRLHLTPDKNCPLCGENQTMTDIQPENYEAAASIDINQIPEDQQGSYEYVDVREEFECMMEPADWPHQHLPLSKWPDPSFKIEKDKKYIFFCAKGIRSLDLVEHLRSEGYDNTQSLNNGVNALNLKAHEQKNRKSNS